MEAERVVVGILAHVDAGKTTLAESLLYKSGAIRRAGRVDHKDACLDTYALEKQRGITIFSKMAQLTLGRLQVTLLDTPGHVDFSAETERTLQVLDYAILVISGADGVQGQVPVLWSLLQRHHVPVFLFLNKMDQPGTDEDALMRELKSRLEGNFVNFRDWKMGKPLPAELAEEIALCDESLMERYLEGVPIDDEQIRSLICERALFPVLPGSALRMEGVDALLQLLEECIRVPVYPEAFAARVYKIAREEQTRLTFLKVTGGTLRVRQAISLPEGSEKADQIRLYSGAGWSLLESAGPGTVCAVTGLEHTFAGEGLGEEQGSVMPTLEPVMSYTLLPEEGGDLHTLLRQTEMLAEEIPEIRPCPQEDGKGIRLQVMGEVQIEILRSLLMERFGVKALFSEGTILYKETIANRVEGVGHYEPLRHYAEVHLIMEPGERGSGLVFASGVSTDDLDLNWQRLILTHLQEKRHRGVLTGAELTDVHILLAAGKAHLKHTEGGDFRQATYRAVRQGLMKAQSILLEPIYRFTMELPQETVGRAMADLTAMHGSFDPPRIDAGTAILSGSAPVAGLQGYAPVLRSYTAGKGRLQCSLQGYEPCRNAQEVIEAAGYDPEKDQDNPAGSIFCSHGAGVYVPWQEVEEHMHLPSALSSFREEETAEKETADRSGASGDGAGAGGRDSFADEEELMRIFERTYGSAERKRPGYKKTRNYISEADRRTGAKQHREQERAQVLLVDGYNVIYSWEELTQLAQDNLDAARWRLMDILSNYQGYRGMDLILVFDAYKVSGGEEKHEQYHNIHVVYTKEAESADAYIERTVHRMAKDYDITVATSDGAEQLIIWGKGALRLTGGELKEDVLRAAAEIRQEYLRTHPGQKQYLFENVEEELWRELEELRLGRMEGKTT